MEGRSHSVKEADERDDPLADDPQELRGELERLQIEKVAAVEREDFMAAAAIKDKMAGIEC